MYERFQSRLWRAMAAGFPAHAHVLSVSPHGGLVVGWKALDDFRHPDRYARTVRIHLRRPLAAAIANASPAEIDRVAANAARAVLSSMADYVDDRDAPTGFHINLDVDVLTPGFAPVLIQVMRNLDPDRSSS